MFYRAFVPIKLIKNRNAETYMSRDAKKDRETVFRDEAYRFNRERDIQLERAACLDALIVLGNEHDCEGRIRHALEIVMGLEGLRSGPHYLVLAGRGRRCADETATEAALMKRYLLSQGIPQEIIRTEEKSIDTLGNFFYARPILEEILVKAPKRLGIVTDSYHMERSMLIARAVLGECYELFPLPTGNRGTPAVSLSEFLGRLAFYAGAYGITAGDSDALTRYLKHNSDRDLRHQ